MLILECKTANVILKKKIIISDVNKENDEYIITVGSDKYLCDSLIVATGGLSVPKVGASEFGYNIAKKFNLNIIETLPALVPLTFNKKILEMCKELSGLSLEAVVFFNKIFFQEGLLFTHRGLSGPSILQISSYWRLGDDIMINLSPKLDIYRHLENEKKIKT